LLSKAGNDIYTVAPESHSMYKNPNATPPRRLIGAKVLFLSTTCELDSTLLVSVAELCQARIVAESLQRLNSECIRVNRL
jgi:hypothetical protein